MDALSIHPYRYPGSPEDTRFVEEIGRARALMAKYGMADRKLWLTEIGWPTHLQASGVSEQTSANHLVRMYTLARSLPYVERVFWYDFQDDGPDPQYNEHRFGIVKWATYQPKASLVAYWTMARHLAGAEYVGRLLPAGADDRRYAFAFRRGKERIVVAWAAGTTATAAFSLGAKSARLQWADAHLAQRKTQQGVLTLELGDMPIFISGEFPEVRAATPSLELTARPARPAPGDEVTVTARLTRPAGDPGASLDLTRLADDGGAATRLARASGAGLKRPVSARIAAPATEGQAVRLRAVLKAADGSPLAEASGTVVTAPF
jgi:hypothetical protein